MLSSGMVHLDSASLHSWECGSMGEQRIDWILIVIPTSSAHDYSLFSVVLNAVWNFSSHITV